jgi:hypothetical protein
MLEEFDFSRRLPMSYQDFKSLREDNYLYADKTGYIWQLANAGKQYFLGRPRRFGKSLFLSALKYYFLGRKDLFEGLLISKYEKEWRKRPVFYLDFNLGDYLNVVNFNLSIARKVSDYEKERGGFGVNETLAKSSGKCLKVLNPS